MEMLKAVGGALVATLIVGIGYTIVAAIVRGILLLLFGKANDRSLSTLACAIPFVGVLFYMLMTPGFPPDVIGGTCIGLAMGAWVSFMVLVHDPDKQVAKTAATARAAPPAPAPPTPATAPAPVPAPTPAPTRGPAPSAAIASELTPDVEAEVRELLAEGNKIEAVRHVRDATGLGLAEARFLVDRLQRGPA